jgi:thioredoxin
VEIRDSTFHAEITDWPGVSLVFFWAPWCAHCRAMVPPINEIARQKAGLLKVGTINTEKETQLARRFDVLSVPRLMLFQGNRVIAEVNGAMRKDQIEDWIAHLLI